MSEPGHESGGAPPSEKLFMRSLALARRGLNFVSRHAYFGPISVHTQHGDLFAGEEARHELRINTEAFLFWLNVRDDGKIKSETFVFDEDDDKGGLADWNIYAQLEADVSGLNEITNQQGLGYIKFLEYLYQVSEEAEAAGISPSQLGDSFLEAVEATAENQDEPDPLQERTAERIKELLEELTLKQPPESMAYIQGLLADETQSGCPRHITISVPLSSPDQLFSLSYMDYQDGHPHSLEFEAFKDGTMLFKSGPTPDPEQKWELLEKTRSVAGNRTERLLMMGYRLALEDDIQKVEALLNEAETGGIHYAETGIQGLQAPGDFPPPEN
ncbi:MAG TPA: hypothetical protein VFP35_03420 [Candidatus Saccharimonadales bacterium]|nr:hypothetical protein [Candidatus Saccharimonadales bacterium]